MNTSIPTIFKEALLAYLSRFCAGPHSAIRRAAVSAGCGSASHNLASQLLPRDTAQELGEEPLPGEDALPGLLEELNRLNGPLDRWPEFGTRLGRLLRVACAQVFLNPHSAPWREALRKLAGPARYEELMQFLAAMRAAHFLAEARSELESEQGTAPLPAAREVAERCQSETRVRRAGDDLFAFAAVSTPDGTVMEVNRAPFEAAGISAADVLGEKICDCFWKNCSPEVQAQLWEAAARARAGEVVRYDALVRMGGDARVWIDFQLAPLSDEEGRITQLVPPAMEITARHEAEEALRESEERFRIMADSLPLIMWVHDAEGRQEFVNATFCEYFGVRREEMRDTHWQILMHPEDGARYAQEFSACVRDRKSFHGEGRVRRADGAWRWIESRARPRFGNDGAFLGHVGTSADITERKQAEDALREADQRKDEFLATLAHELRNPLAPLQNGLALLELAADKPRMFMETRDMMARQLSQLVRLMDDLLDVSRIGRGKIELRKRRVDIALVLHDTVEVSRPLLEERSFDIALPRQPLYVCGDATRLQQIFTNLLNNARKFTEPGGHIRLSAGLEENDVAVSVKDDGVGIPPEKLQAVFNIFTQLDTAPENLERGLGIGLSLVMQLVELHGGTVSAHSEGPGSGAEFIVRLPNVEAPAAEAPMRTPPAITVQRVLVVDDNQDAAQSLGLLLELHYGCEIEVAYSGTEALMKANAFMPELILLDIGMPDMDGYDTCRAFRREPGGKDFTIVALTGWGQAEDRRRSADAGFDAHLVKPVAREALLKLLSAG